MAEKIYAWLLRLYPAHFRKTCGEDALQLFRDRSRDERGFPAGLRLWLDLLSDLAVSISLEYRHAQPAMAGASARQRLDWTPSFQVLEGDSPRPGALLSGALLLALIVTAIPLLIGRGGSYAPFGPWARQPRTRSAARSAAVARPPQSANSAPAGSTNLDAAERRRVVDAVIANLRQHYVYPDIARKMADALLAHEKGGDYDAVTDGAAFAALLTTQIRDVSQDAHLIVEYRKEPLPDGPPGPPPGALERYRTVMRQENCTFEKVEILPRNIGYLKLNSFPDPSLCRPTATAAMASLNHADAIIFDLRDNGGGYPDMVALIAAYLFDHPEYWYNPRENTTEQSWTRSPVPRNRLADKPVYVLTSNRTFSGAEQFSYDLKMLKRARIVGETTRGGAHAGRFHRIDDHFGMGVPEVRAINPFSKSDWEGTGVEPDVKVKAADALETAEKLAASRLRNKK
jgi:hypothetical protein